MPRRNRYVEIRDGSRKGRWRTAVGVLIGRAFQGRETRVMKEFRCIVFSDQEAISAIIERRQKQREQLPVGTILGLTHNSDGSNTFTLMTVDDYGKKTPVIIAIPEMAAALVCYCLDRRIPMPASAKKGIEIMGSDITLVMTIADFDLTKPRSASKSKKMPTPQRRSF